MPGRTLVIAYPPPPFPRPPPAASWPSARDRLEPQRHVAGHFMDGVVPFIKIGHEQHIPERCRYPRVVLPHPVRLHGGIRGSAHRGVRRVRREFAGEFAGGFGSLVMHQFRRCLGRRAVGLELYFVGGEEVAHGFLKVGPFDAEFARLLFLGE
jgi:hypothetical protein